MTNINKVCKDFNLVRLDNMLMLQQQYNTLLGECYSQELEGYRPAAFNNISNLYQMIDTLFETKKEVIVFAFDALSFEYFYSEIMPQMKSYHLKYGSTLSSVFPSTSSTCWTSVLTNSQPSEHGIYGTSFTHEDTNMNYVWHRNYYCHGSQFVQNRCKNTKFNLVLSTNNIFQLLLKKKIICYDLGHYFEESPSNPLIDRITKGTIRIKSNQRILDLLGNPNIVLSGFLEEIQKILIHDQEKKLIWTYIDTDNYIHHHGYKKLSENIDWKKLFQFWDDNYNEDRAFLFLADHGQTQQRNVTVDILKESIDNENLRCNTGGAGRVLYFYPKQEMQNEVRKWINNKIGDSGRVYTKDELIQLGLINSDAKGIDRIGDLIAIGYRPEFPSTGPEYLFEHGALSKEEMFVPLVLMTNLIGQ